VRKWPFFVLTAGVSAALDLATKAWVQAAVEPFESIPVVPGFFHLTHVMNRGAAFSILSEAEGLRTPILVAVTLLALAFVLWMYVRLDPGRRIAEAGLALIFGGAVGNLADRLRYGAVVDFLDVFWRGYHWPAFNVADAAICVGAGLVIIAEFTGRKPHAA